jgi:hypothetical protein
MSDDITLVQRLRDYRSSDYSSKSRVGDLLADEAATIIKNLEKQLACSVFICSVVSEDLFDLQELEGVNLTEIERLNVQLDKDSKDAKRYRAMRQIAVKNLVKYSSYEKFDAAFDKDIKNNCGGKNV